MSSSGESKRVNVGCGPNKIEGWINIDSVDEFKPDIVHDISDPLLFEDCSVDKLNADGILEHFDKYMRYAVVGDWARVLKIGGTLMIGVPDMWNTIRKFKKFGFNNFVDFVFGETMYQSETYIGHYGTHKWGYSAKSLKEFIEQFGIGDIKVIEDSLQLKLTGHKKKHIRLEDLDDVQVYAHANAFGIGKPYLPLKFIKGRIKVFQEQESKQLSKTQYNV